MLQVANRSAATDNEQCGAYRVAETTLNVAEAAELGVIGIAEVWRADIDDGRATVDVGPMIVAFNAKHECASLPVVAGHTANKAAGGVILLGADERGVLGPLNNTSSLEPQPPPP